MANCGSCRVIWVASVWYSTMIPTTNEITSPDPKMRPVAVRVVQYATSWATSSGRVKTCVSAGKTARIACAAWSGSVPGFKRDEAEIYHIGRAFREHPEKVRLAGDRDAKPEKPSAELICPADRYPPPGDLDDAPRPQRAEQRSGLAVDEHGV